MIIRTSQKLLATAATAALLTSPAFAQTNNEDDTLDVVIANATISGRAQIDTAVASTAISNKLIENFSPSTETELLRLIPGIQVPGSGGPAGNANIAVRGLPVLTGGAPFVQIQEDGLPTVLFGDDAFANNDYWTRYDFTVDNVQAVRGGAAATSASQAPGAVINYISRTGAVEGGSAKFTTGLGFDEKRVDFRYGAPIAEDLSFHVGGYFRNGEGVRDAGFNTIDSIQLKGNITKEIGDKGFFRVNAKFADTKEPMYHNAPVTASGNAADGFSDYTAIPEFNAQDDALMGAAQRSWQVLGTDGTISTRDYDGVTTKQAALGVHFEYDLNEQFTIENKGRYSRISGSVANTWGNYGYADAPGDATFQYATGPNAGQNVAAGTLLHNSANVRVDVDSMDNFVNDLAVTGVFDTDAATVTAKAGYFMMRQSLESAWHPTARVGAFGGDNAQIVNQFDANGAQLTANGMGAFNAGWGGGNAQVNDIDATNTAPYVGVDVDFDRFVVDGSLRFDKMNVSGTHAVGGVIAGGTDVLDNFTGATVNLPSLLTGGGLIRPLDYKTDATSWTVGGLFRASDDTSIFLRGSKGHRFNVSRRAGAAGEYTATGALSAAGEPTHVDAVKQFELGIKNRGNLGSAFYTVDLSLLSAKFSQNALGLGVGDCGAGNTGTCLISSTIKSKGFELFSTVDAGDLDVTLNATYTDAEDQNGVTPARVPKLTYTVNGNYEISDMFSVNVGASGNSKTANGDAGSIIVNGGVRVSPFENISFGLDAYNLFDTFTFRGNDVGTAGTALRPNLITGIPVDGRTLRASVRYDF